MAEAFGAAAGALSIAGLFNNFVNAFEYIQLGRHFGEDFERCQLKLDVARLRLTRWGEAVEINKNPAFQSEAMENETLAKVQSILAHLSNEFQSVCEKSRLYENGKNADDLARYEEDNLQPLARRLHDRVGALARQRQGSVGIVKKTAWALYDGKRLQRLIDEISELTGFLEVLYPVAEGRHMLVNQEIEGITDEPSLLALQGAAEDNDQILWDAVKQKMNEMSGRNQSGDIKSDGSASVRVGTDFGLTTRGFIDKTQNIAGSIDAKGTSAVHIGNRFV